MRRTIPSRPRRLRLSLGLIGVAAPLLVLLAGRSPAPFRVDRAQYRMGTVLEIDAIAFRPGGAERGVEEAFDAIGRAEARLSNWRPESELSRANRDGSRAPVPLSPETYGSVARSLDLARLTEGAFDPTVGAVTAALGLTGGPRDPVRARALAPTIGWDGVRLDPERRTIFFERPGAQLDSGAFGKGEALDRADAVLRREGVAAARMNFGGQISLLGAHSPAGSRAGFARVSVAAPDAFGEELCAFEMDDGSVSTSSDSEKPGHLLDPRTGGPAPFHGSATAVADTAFRADALSTALFVMGPDRGIAFADRLGISALFVVPASGGFALRPSRRFPRVRRLSAKVLP